MKANTSIMFEGIDTDICLLTECLFGPVSESSFSSAVVERLLQVLRDLVATSVFQATSKVIDWSVGCTLTLKYDDWVVQGLMSLYAIDTKKFIFFKGTVLDLASLPLLLYLATLIITTLRTSCTLVSDFS